MKVNLGLGDFFWSHAKCLSLLALGFTHHKGLSYQIIELEDSGLPQQGILPISAKKRKTMATEVLGKKTLPTVPGWNCSHGKLFTQRPGWNKRNLRKIQYVLIKSPVTYIQDERVGTACCLEFRFCLASFLLVLGIFVERVDNRPAFFVIF